MRPVRGFVHSFAKSIAGVRLGALMLAVALISGGATARQPQVQIDHNPLEGAAVAADDPRAAAAAWAALEAGGDAVDAAIAAAFVLTVVMPEAASLAAAGAALHYDAEGRHVTALVGREVAGAAADPAWIEAEGGRIRKRLVGGAAVGAPTLLQMLGEMRAIGGRLPWADVAAAAIAYAREGTPLSDRAADALNETFLPQNGGVDELFGMTRGALPRPGALYRNPELADLLATIGRDGPSVLAGGVAGHAISRHIADVRRAPAVLTLDEIAEAAPTIAAPMCVALKRAALCAPPAPTIGPMALETTALVEAAMPPAPSAFEWTNVIAQAHRLAVADVRRYLGDPLVFPDLTPSLIAPSQIDRRAQRISTERDRGRPAPSRLRGAPPGLVSAYDNARPLPTASVTVVDGDGDAVALSLSLTTPFGSGLATRGLILNAANAAFDPPAEIAGRHVANALRPGARARLDLAPVMALDGERRLILAAAGAGGENLPAYIAKVAIAALDLDKSAADAIGAPNVASRDVWTELEIRTPAERLDKALADIGHRPRIKPMPSGLLLILRRDGRFEAAADPRGSGDARSAPAPARPPATGRALDLEKRGS